MDEQGKIALKRKEVEKLMLEREKEILEIKKEISILDKKRIELYKEAVRLCNHETEYAFTQIKEVFHRCEICRVYIKKE